MNKLMMVVGIIFLVCAFIGYKRGLIKIAASLAATILSLVLVTVLSPYVGKAILKYTPLEESVQKKCIEMFKGTVIGEGAEEFDPSVVELTSDQEIMVIENAKIPSIFQELLIENNNEVVYEALGVTSFMEYIGGYLAKIIANILGFLVTILIVMILVRTFMFVFNIIGKLPVIGGVNRIAGGILGLGTGLIIVWVVMIAVSLLYNTNFGQAALTDIENSKILTYLYEHNMLMNRLVKF